MFVGQEERQNFGKNKGIALIKPHWLQLFPMAGRPEHEVTDEGKELVKLLSASGMTQEQVAGVLKIDVKTLRKHYKHEYDNGNELMVSELVPVSFTVAKDPNHKDSSKERQFLLQTKGGFVKTERQIVQDEFRKEMRDAAEKLTPKEAAQLYAGEVKG